MYEIHTSTNEIQYLPCASYSIQWQSLSVHHQNSTVHSPTHHPAGYIIHPIMIIPTNYFQPAYLRHNENNSTSYSSAAEQRIWQPVWSRIEGYSEFTYIQEAKHAALQHHDDDESSSSSPQKLNWTRHIDKQFACTAHFQCCVQARTSESGHNDTIPSLKKIKSLHKHLYDTKRSKIQGPVRIFKIRIGPRAHTTATSLGSVRTLKIRTGPGCNVV